MTTARPARFATPGKAWLAAGSRYAQGTLPVNLYLLKGDRVTARKYLDGLNATNKAKGLPAQTLKDFEMWH